MRINRALEKLRTQLTRRGFTSTAVTLGALLTSQTLQAAPAGLALQAAAAIQQTLVPASLLSSFILKLKIMTTFKLAASAVTLSAVLICSGIVFANQQTPPAQSTPFPEQNTGLPEENTALPEESIQAPSNVTPQAPTTPITPQKIRQPRKPTNKATFVRHNGQILLAKNTIQRLALSEDEAIAMAAAIKEAWNSLDTVAAQNASTQRTAPGTFTIKITPFTQGADIYDRLLGTLAQTLGDERNKIFLDEIAGSFEHELRYCGATERTFTIKKTYDSSGQFLEYRVADTWTSAYNRSGKGIKRYQTKAEFVAEYPFLGKLLPSDF